MTRICVAGVAVLDFVFQVQEMPGDANKYRAQDATIVGGGCAANAAVAIARLGGDASLVARLGDDAIADIILNDLKSERVDTANVHRSEGGKSSFSSIYLDHEGERQIMNFRGNSLVQNTDWLDENIEFDAYLADNRWPAMTSKMMSIAKDKNIPGIIDAEDPIDLNSIKDASHIAFSRQGLVALTGENELSTALMVARKNLNAWLCVTDGPAGVFFIHANKVEHIPGFDVVAADTLGAGDIWHGAFTLRIAEGACETNAIEFANAAAAIKCTVAGGRKGCPNRTQTNNFLTEN